MKQTEDLILLSESNEAYIAKCKCCSKINVIYKNIALKLSLEEFYFFKHYFDQINPEYYFLESYTGKNIFVNSPIRNIVFCFSSEEVEELKKILNEAAVMMQVFEILE